MGSQSRGEGPLLAGEGFPGQELLSLGGTALLLLGPLAGSSQARLQNQLCVCLGVGVEEVDREMRESL